MGGCRIVSFGFVGGVVWSTQSEKPLFAPSQTFPNLRNTKSLGANHGMKKVKVNHTKEFETKSLDDKSESNQKVNRLSGLTTNHSMHSIAMINSVKV